jgi:putative aldouronate transport system permease protein
MVSITDEGCIQKYGYSLIPIKLSLSAYTTIFTEGALLFRSYMITIFVTVTGTLGALTITGMAAYTLANKNIKYRNAMALFIFIPMVFNGGIVPWYMICRVLGLRNNLAALIIPSLLFSPFNFFLTRNFIMGIPDSLRESAKIDGAGDIRIAFQIYLPVCTPVLAAITLFYGLAYWNNWWNAIMLIDNPNMFPLQYLLLKIRTEIRMLEELRGAISIANLNLPTESLKMATAIITIGPIILLYPYLQRYLVKGLTIGSVKG